MVHPEPSSLLFSGGHLIMTNDKIAIIGGGPAGLMAAQHLLDNNFDVHLFDSMPSLGRKFLMAGKSGINLTHGEDFEKFRTRYHTNFPHFQDIIADFKPDDVRNWAHNLGVNTFVGSSARVFPTDFKAAPLLRSWLRHLRARGLTIHTRHRWHGWNDGDLLFKTPDGNKTFRSKATLFATGGISWPKLGSDGQWQIPFQEKNIAIADFKPSNCGFHCHWSTFFIEHFAGVPVKSVGLHLNNNVTKGEFVISQNGVEGSAIYSHSRLLREELERTGVATLYLDLCPDRPLENLTTALKKPKGRASLSNHIRKTTGLRGVKTALLRECLDKDTFNDMDKLARSIKSLPLSLHASAAIENAISCAGGVRFDDLNADLMHIKHPGLFFAGEMLDWDAPTGGYLLTGCFALGKRAGLGIRRWMLALP